VSKWDISVGDRVRVTNSLRSNYNKITKIVETIPISDWRYGMCKYYLEGSNHTFIATEFEKV